jgi:hypothetical protein
MPVRFCLPTIPFAVPDGDGLFPTPADRFAKLIESEGMIKLTVDGRPRRARRGDEELLLSNRVIKLAMYPK